MNALTEAITCHPPLIEDVALAIADDAYPNLSRMRYHGMLDDIARPLFSALHGVHGLDRRLEIMRHYLCVELGFVGNRDVYYDPRNSYINDVLERRIGIPISLAVIWMAVGRRVHVRVSGVGFPGHFLVHVGRFGSGRYVDVFNRGLILDEDKLERLLRERVGSVSAASSALGAVGAREMAERMLFNLRSIHDGRGDHARAMLVCDRLFELTANPTHRRDRGVHALELGVYESALRDFEAYLIAFPDAVDSEWVADLLAKAQRGTCALN